MAPGRERAPRDRRHPAALRAARPPPFQAPPAPPAPPAAPAPRCPLPPLPAALRAVPAALTAPTAVVRHPARQLRAGPELAHVCLWTPRCRFRAPRSSGSGGAAAAGAGAGATGGAGVKLRAPSALRLLRLQEKRAAPPSSGGGGGGLCPGPCVSGAALRGEGSG